MARKSLRGKRVGVMVETEYIHEELEYYRKRVMDLGGELNMRSRTSSALLLEQNDGWAVQRGATCARARVLSEHIEEPGISSSATPDSSAKVLSRSATARDTYWPLAVQGSTQEFGRARSSNKMSKKARASPSPSG